MCGHSLTDSSKQYCSFECMIKGVRDIKEVEQVRGIKRTLSIGNIGGVEKDEGIENNGGVERTEDIENIGGVERIESIGDIEGVERIGDMANVEDEDIEVKDNISDKNNEIQITWILDHMNWISKKKRIIDRKKSSVLKIRIFSHCRKQTTPIRAPIM